MISGKILSRSQSSFTMVLHVFAVMTVGYIQACGDYATLVTPTGEYIKEQTMKYFEGHLPTNNFVRIHRSTIVNVTQISRVELFGKETLSSIIKERDQAASQSDGLPFIERTTRNIKT